jgi:diaminopimelate decarboxylase
MGDYLTATTAGAYRFSRTSNYDSRPRAAEILVEGAALRVIRARETHANSIHGEAQ